MNKFKNILYFIIYLVINPRLIKLAILQKIYIPVYMQYEWLKEYKIKTIVDVGAHNGRVLKVLNFLFPKAFIYAFEPNKNLHKTIKSKIKSSNLRLENFALSDKKGKILFNVYSDSTLSSIMDLVKEGVRKGKRVSYVKTLAPVTTLDSYFLKIRSQKNIFLKIDTEGAEGLVLKGGKKFLKNVDIIHIETYFDRFYKNQLLFNDIYSFLLSYGFKYMGEVNEANFYPIFGPKDISNSVFVKQKSFPALMDK